MAPLVWHGPQSLPLALLIPLGRASWVCSPLGRQNVHSYFLWESEGVLLPSCTPAVDFKVMSVLEVSPPRVCLKILMKILETLASER